MAYSYMARSTQPTWRNAVSAMRSCNRRRSNSSFLTRGREEHYIGGAQVTERMFHLIKREMTPRSGQFIRVIDGNAMVCELPLAGMEAHLAVLSSRDKTVALAAKIRSHNKDGWVNEFMRRHEEAAA